MKEISELITTLEVLRDAVDAKDGDKSFEAVTVFLIQFMDVFGHDPKIVTATLPIIEKLKNHVRSHNFDDAYPVVLAFLVKFRTVQEAMDKRKSR